MLIAYPLKAVLNHSTNSLVPSEQALSMSMFITKAEKKEIFPGVIRC